MLECDINYHVYSIYECSNKEQLIKYYHAILISHPKTTLIAAANAGYLRGCPSLTASDISKFIVIKDATEMGHMKQLQQGVRSTSTKSSRGRPAALTQQSTGASATNDEITTPPQEPSNIKTSLVFMSV